MAWWERQAGKTTRSRIVAMLRRGERTVEELAESLAVTDNAVRAQLAALERERVVQSAGIRRDGGVGKPATLFRIADQNSALFSNAYAPVLAALLAELSERMAPRQIEALLRRTGKRLAASLQPRATFDERVKAGAAFLASVGADADLVQTAAGYELRGHGCVLATAVAVCPASCALVEQLLRDVTGARVTEQCDRSERPNCRFAIAKAS